MPRQKATSALAGLVGSDSEPDLDHFDAAEIQAARAKNSKVAAKKPRGRPAANKVTKPSPTQTRRGRCTTANESAPAAETAEDGDLETSRGSGKGKRKGKGVKQAADKEADSSVVEPPPSAALVRAKPGRGRPKAAKNDKNKVEEEEKEEEEKEEEEREDDSTISEGAATKTVKRRGRPPARRPEPIPEEIPETQEQDLMELDAAPEEEEEVSDLTGVQETAEIVAGYGVSDAELRRRLGEINRKYESLEMRHRDLREIGVKEAEKNFDRLRKQSDERTATANKAIAALKEEVAEQTKLAKQGKQLQKQLDASQANAEELQATINKLNASLSEARGEITTLSTKLAAARTAEANARVVPGSALKPKAATSRAAQAEAVQAAHVAQSKEDLYGDLTGLIMRGVRRIETEDVFDCIQTGKNGTLHFKLAVDTDDGVDYEDTVVSYQPQIDDNRDQELVDVLPDYLVEEIDFPRRQASKFYHRLHMALQGRD